MADRRRYLELAGRHIRLDPRAICAGQLLCWWHADDHGTALMVDDGGGAISAWNDRIAGVSLSALGTQRPLWSATGFYVPGWVKTPRAGVVADGLNTWLDKTSTVGTPLPVGAAPSEIWVTYTNTGGAVARYLACYGSVTNPRAIRQTVGAGVGVLGGQCEGVTIGDRWPDTPGAGVVGLICDGVNVGGRTRGYGFSGGPLAVVPATGTTRMRLFQSFGVGQVWQGAARQVLVTGLLSRAQRLELEAALAWDAGLSLIYTHPYRWGRP